MADDEASYSIWANLQTRNNLVVLTADTLYVASIWKSQLPRIDHALEEGESADQLLPKAYKIRLKSIDRFQLKHAQVVVHQLMNKEVTVHYQDARKARKLKITFDLQSSRDEFVNQLNERLGRWTIMEKYESPWLILANYLYIILVIGGMAMLFSWIALNFPPNDDGTMMSRYWYATGPWGLAVPAMLVSVAVLVAGILQLRTPPIIVTYSPESPG